MFRVAIQNAGVAENERLYVNPYGLETWAHLVDRTRYRAPGDSGEIETQIPFALLRDNPARAAYLLVERIYLWFGVPTNEIPYTVGEGEQKALDLEMIRRGGKPPAG